MADIFTDATACLSILATHTPVGRARILSIIRSAIDLGDEHGAAPLAGDVTMSGRALGTGVIVLPRAPAVQEADAPRVAPLETPRRKARKDVFDLPVGPKTSSPKEPSLTRFQCEKAILESLRSSPKTRADLAQAIRIDRASGTLNNSINKLARAGKIEKTGDSTPTCAIWSLAPESPQ